MADAPRITIEDLQGRMSAGEEFVFVDARNPKAWAESDKKIPGALRIPLDALDENISNIPSNKSIVAYCT
jgi:rhodanese-related sulfurtransferase